MKEELGASGHTGNLDKPEPGTTTDGEQKRAESPEAKKYKLIALLVSSVEEFNKWRAENKEPGALAIDPSDADLSQANLAGAKLSLANLRNVNFSGADLTGVDVSGSSFRGANFWGAQMDQKTWDQIRGTIESSMRISK